MFTFVLIKIIFFKPCSNVFLDNDFLLVEVFLFLLDFLKPFHQAFNVGNVHDQMPEGASGGTEKLRSINEAISLLLPRQ